MTFDYYFKDTDPLLVSIGMPPSAAATSLYTNMGRQISRGWTGTLNYVFLRKKDLSCSVNMNARANHSEYRDIGDKLDYLNKVGSSTALNRYYEGGSPDDLWAVPSLGIDPETGKEVFVKKDGSLTTIWDYNDKVVCGTTDPKFRGTLNSFLTFKGISLNMSFNFQWGGQTYNQTLASRVEGVNPNSNCDRRVLYDRWKKPGDRTFLKISLWKKMCRI